MVKVTPNIKRFPNNKEQVQVSFHWQKHGTMRISDDQRGIGLKLRIINIKYYMQAI